jgi:hypothetical protein
MGRRLLLAVSCSVLLYCLLQLSYAGFHELPGRAPKRSAAAGLGVLDWDWGDEPDDLDTKLNEVDAFILRRRAKAAVMGALVADAACMPLHGCAPRCLLDERRPCQARSHIRRFLFQTADGCRVPCTFGRARA